jgi:hypothetical protein
MPSRRTLYYYIPIELPLASIGDRHDLSRRTGLPLVLATLLKKFCPVIHLNPLDPEEASQPDSPSVRVVG